MTLNLKIIIGSTRPGRVGPVIATWVQQVALEHGRFDVDLVDLQDLKLPLLDESAHPLALQYEQRHTHDWSQIVDSADAYIFVTPEYDFFAPATLVNAIQVILKEWGYKVAGVVSYGGISGGLRSSQNLRQLLGNVNVHALPQVVPIPMFPKFIGEDGVFHPSEPMEEGMILQLDELFKWASALRVLRGA